jgi:hypothetical protein
MTSFLDQPETKYLGTAVFFLGAAYSMIKWVGRTLREQLGPGVSRPGDGVAITHVDNVPQALVKSAIERGIVTPSQLAAMAPMERQFLFASLKDRLGAPPVQPAATPPAPRAAPLAVPPATPPTAPATIDGAEFGLASLPANERLRVRCPTCGNALAFPAFAPYVAHCRECGTKTAVREDVEGHYLLNVTPAQKPETARGPSLV